MSCLSLLRALPAFLAVIQTVSSASLSLGDLHPRTVANGTVWPVSVVGEVHDRTWSNFTEATTRWSSYEAPTFNQVFLPKTEEDLSLGVSIVFLMSDASMPGEPIDWKYTVCSFTTCQAIACPGWPNREAMVFLQLSIQSKTPSWSTWRTSSTSGCKPMEQHL